MNAKLDLAEAVKETRAFVNISLKKLATASGLDSAYLSRIETRKIRNPGIENVLKIADGLARAKDNRLASQEEFRQKLLRAAGLEDESPPDAESVRQRFSARLSKEGLTRKQIQAAVDQVSLPTMRRVLDGDEPLEKYPVSALYDPEVRLDLNQDVVFIPGDESDQNAVETFPAGTRASFTVHGGLSESQRSLLRSVGKLIEKIVSEK